MKLKPYQADRHELFDTETGQGTFAATCFCVAKAQSEFTAGDMLDATCKMRGAVCSWAVLNALDYLTEVRAIQELTAGQDVIGQNRRYRRLW